MNIQMVGGWLFLEIYNFKIWQVVAYRGMGGYWNE